MKSLTIRLPDDLMDWLAEQAELGKRSINRHIELLAEQARNSPHSTPTHQTGSTTLCNNGKHHFMKPQPDNGEFCNCSMFMYGEVCNR